MAEVFSWITENWLGVTGLVTGLLCVWLLIRQNILTFPIGLLYSIVTVFVMYANQLYADVLVNFYYLLMNAYGWWFWLRGDAERRSADDMLIVSWMPKRLVWPVVLIAVSGVAMMGWYFDTQTDADLAYPDSFTTVLAFIAMWMSAKKYLDNWVLWFVVNVVSVVLYGIKAQQDPQLYMYLVLYAVYIWLAVVGWQRWRADMPDARFVRA